MAELLKVREITIDTMQYKDFATKEEELKVMRFYQNDLNSAKLLINVTHDKVVTDFSTATKVQIALLKPDGKRVFQDVQNVNQMQGKYYVVLSTQTLIVYGNVIAQLRLIFPNNKVIETCKFVFAVDESIMSDEAMASTNEFPVIQKAIEAGEKLEGVDIDGIIAAGAKAEAALPKAGGTMTGNLSLDRTDNTVTRDFRWTTGGNSDVYVGLDNAGLWRAYATGLGMIFSYDKNTKEFNVPGSTNLLKKSGDTMTGTLVVEDSTGTSSLRVKSGDYIAGWQQRQDGLFRLIDWSKNASIMEYNPISNSMNFRVDTNLVKKSEIYTGLLQPIGNTVVATGSNADEMLTPGLYSGTTITNQPLGTGIVYLTVFSHSPSYTRQEVRSATNHTGLVYERKRVSGTWGAWTEVTSRGKDGRVVLTLSADAKEGSSSPQLATRRGNTVTLSLDVIRNAGATGLIVTTLPADMCPTESYSFDAISVDGSVSRILVRYNGEVHIDATGKRFRFLTTYVAN